MRSFWVNRGLCLQARFYPWELEFTWLSLASLCEHKTEGMPSVYYDLQLRIIEDQILILLCRAEFPPPWAV